MERADPPTLAKQMNKAATIQIILEVKTRILPLFYQLLELGFRMMVPVNCSVKELLCQHLNVQEDYLEKRIQTLILNGKAVDDVNSATVGEGSTLALSGAMPGLVGAILRSDGVLAPMRHQISHKQTESDTKYDAGEVNLKLFNLVLKELGPVFLQKGIWFKGETLQDFFSRRADELMEGCHTLTLDGNSLDISQLARIDLSNKSVFLQVATQ